MRGRIGRWGVLAATTVAALGAVRFTASEGRTTASPSRAGDARAEVYRECPGDRHDFAKDRSLSLYAPAAASPIEKIKDIPEFHDCQKLLLDSGRAYGPLVAIFATYDLASLDTALMRRDPRGEGRIALAGAVIHNFGDLYEPLNLASGFSCLYLWRTGTAVPTWHAKTVAAPDAAACSTPYVPTPGEPAALEVRPVRARFFDEGSDYPAVARWDWDDQNKKQYMGLRCGAAWCEVGLTGFRPSAPYGAAATSGSDAERVKRIKGWYDEQSLAVPGPGGAFIPGKARATVIPAPKRDLVDSNYHHRWARVAYIALDRPSRYYRKKLNLYFTRPGAPLSLLNVLSFCKGTRTECRVPAPSAGVPFSAECGDESEATPGERWWVRIDAARGRGRGPMYRCVDRVGHETEGVDIPPTARWHWLNEDETVWKECVTGCCQVRVLGDP